MARGLTVQSIIYGNDPQSIVRAAGATSNSARIARDEGIIGEWTLALGDSTPKAVLAAADTELIRALVGAAGGDFSYSHFGQNLGHGGGQNKLATLTSSDLILILNPDAILGTDAVARLAATVTGKIGAADGRQLPLEHPKDYDAVTGDESWASGACLMTQRKVFEEVGGFDHETFFMYCDDVDYSWRVRLAGHRVVYQPSARVFHDKRLTIDADVIPTEAEVYFSAEAAVLLAHKYSRPDIVGDIMNSFRQSHDPNYQRVVAEFERRLAQGNLPASLDPAGDVAQFVQGNYAIHRY